VRIRPFRSTAPNATRRGFVAGPRGGIPAAIRFLRSDWRIFPPTNVSSASTSPDSGAASSCVIRWLRMRLNIRHAVL